MRRHKITLIDACEVTGYDRVALKHVLTVIPPYCKEKLSARKAREFAPIDLTVLCVVQALDREFGMKIKAIASLAEELRKLLLVPRPAGRNVGIQVKLSPPAVNYVGLPCKTSGGILVPLSEILAHVDEYTPPSQTNLHLGPAVVRTQERKASG